MVPAAPYDRTPSLTASESTSSDRLSIREPSPASRPLPPLPFPNDAKQRPSPSPRPRVAHSPPPPRPRSRALSSFLSPTPPLSRALKQPRVLAAALRHTSWSDFHALTRTSREFRDLFFSTPDLQEEVLSRFVPAYRYASSKRNLQWYQDVRITLRDLELLAMSESVPLHRYPTHALTILSALLPTEDMDEWTRRFGLLTCAHSRFVLLLQSLVQSSPTFDFQESEAMSPRPPAIPGGLRELTFPAPLYFTDPEATHKTSVVSTPSPPPTAAAAKPKPKKRRTASMTMGSLPNLLSSLDRGSMKRSISSSRPLAMFGLRTRPRVDPPPPLAEPSALKFYSGGWRRAFPAAGVGGASASDDEGYLLRRPRRRFASASADLSSSASVSSSSQLQTPSPREEPDSPPLTGFGTHAGSAPASLSPLSHGGGVPSRPRPWSPHDLQAATLRTRAPILRVFVPCADMSDAAVARCERELVRAGLWEHLSTGDVVCNLGYMPPADPAPPPLPRKGTSKGHTPRRSLDHAAALEEADPNAARTWLVFDGYALAAFTPPAPPPLEAPLLLPSPLYYAHVLPLHTNPTFVLTLPPPTRAPELHLTLLVAEVRSPDSPRGRAVVRKHAWLARCTVHVARPGVGLGPGWLGEWVVEGEGTKEGRQAVLDALRGDRAAEREWEVVREKSGSGRIWFRLLDRMNNTSRTLSASHA